MALTHAHLAGAVAVAYALFCLYLHQVHPRAAARGLACLARARRAT